MIAWNASPEARRAVADAMSFLVAPTSVKSLMVDPAGCKWLGGEIGCDIGHHLARHGARSDGSEVASRGPADRGGHPGRGEGDDTDLLVSAPAARRICREIVFGNATRKLLAKMPVAGPGFALRPLRAPLGGPGPAEVPMPCRKLSPNVRHSSRQVCPALFG